MIFAGETIADTISGYRVLETSHPPVYYIPPVDIAVQFLERAPGTSWCEFKGKAQYWSLSVATTRSYNSAWSYAFPSQEYQSIAGHLAFHPSRVDECWVCDERVQSQEGYFYGGWITARIVGPFKGGPGTLRW